MRDAVADGVSFTLAKLKASDSSLNLQALEADFNYSEKDATKVFEGAKPFRNKVAATSQSMLSKIKLLKLLDFLRFKRVFLV